MIIEDLKKELGYCDNPKNKAQRQAVVEFGQKVKKAFMQDGNRDKIEDKRKDNPTLAKLTPEEFNKQIKEFEDWAKRLQNDID
jgi:hypothetical protein